MSLFRLIIVYSLSVFLSTCIYTFINYCTIPRYRLKTWLKTWAIACQRALPTSGANVTDL